MKVNLLMVYLENWWYLSSVSECISKVCWQKENYEYFIFWKKSVNWYLNKKQPLQENITSSYREQFCLCGFCTFRLFIVPYFFVRLSRERVLPLMAAILIFKPLSSFDARWQPVTQSTWSRWPYGKIGDCEQAIAHCKELYKSHVHIFYLSTL